MSKMQTHSHIESLSWIEVCRIISKNSPEEPCTFTEPDNRLDDYIDFLEAINSDDWINDENLHELCEAVFRSSMSGDGEE